MDENAKAEIKVTAIWGNSDRAEASRPQIKLAMLDVASVCLELLGISPALCGESCLKGKRIVAKEYDITTS